MQGRQHHALRKGLLSIGVKDNEVIVFSELMDAKSLFLTANADTVYVIGALDLSKGPMVLEVPPKVSRRHRRLRGSAGSSTSACPGPTAAKAGNT